MSAHTTFSSAMKKDYSMRPNTQKPLRLIRGKINGIMRTRSEKPNAQVSKGTKVKPPEEALVVKSPKIAVTKIREKIGVSQVDFARITGYSVRSIAGWESGKQVSDAARQKLIETDRLRAALSEIVPAEKLANWLLEPNPAFEGQTPIQIIERGEADRIWRMIHQIEDSVAS
ncbi:DUF2384 domain-containing protein [Telmatocola sphagniphila]|uniref:DUF2384 domain-containing protein n=1 Tax=Telmatocola sphagniphila TaxID=1123043 RepID=A0A8E6B5P2_9BACT|nr:antitoxin Xre/MbcA/ParS toxin-binding domain-containing protein [Telmatocola sphagniphila]QVL32367.1 DUF2384 domain-containing protein [Telmatocola sphagniphila]